jgi:hypothetical protein
MIENDGKNGGKNGAGKIVNGKKLPPERDEKGKFVNSPGPGRGRTKEDPVQLDGDLLDMIEQVVITGLGATELKDRLKAAGIGIRIQSMKEPDDSGPVVEPFVLEFMGLITNLGEAYVNKTGIPISGLDLIKRMAQVCVNCDRLGTEAFKWEEVEKGDAGDTTGSGFSSSN